MGEIILVVGGGRSGKTAFSQELADNHQEVVYLATAQAGDEEMAERIENHKKNRPGHWHTIEAPTNMLSSLNNLPEKTEIVIIDCLTLYLNNFILKREIPQCKNEWEQELNSLLDVAKRIKPTLIFVSNEVGQGIVPASALSRFYRDLHGAMNQTVARAANHVYKMEVGIPVKIKSTWR